MPKQTLKEKYGKAYHNYKINSAGKRGLDWQLTKAQFYALTRLPCFYCEKQLLDDPHDIHGLDRVDNLKGYTTDNVVPCCYMCNKMKGAFTAANFLEHVQLISTKWLK
jgi:hypothetical protein